MKHTIYFPALMPTYSSYFEYSDERLFEKSPNLKNAGITARWPSEKDSFFYHPFILLSAAHHFTKKNFRESARFTDETLVMVDSGGFQMATGKVPKGFDEAGALKWSEENGNIYPIVDRPIVPGCHFDDMMPLTKKAAQYYIDNRSKPDHHILNVVSGKQTGEINRWYKHVKDFEFDGWAHGGHRGSFKVVLLTLFMMYLNGEFDRDKLNYYHIFGTCSFDSVFYLTAFQRWLHDQGLKTQITYDASTQTKSLAYGKMIHSCDWNALKTIALSNKIDMDHHTNEGMWCDCPVCSRITDIDSLLVENREFEFYYLLHQHNLYQVLKMKKYIEWLMDLTPGYKYDNIIIEGSMPVKYKHNLKPLYQAFEDPKHAIEIISRHFKWSNSEDNSRNTANLDSFMG